MNRLSLIRLPIPLGIALTLLAGCHAEVKERGRTLFLPAPLEDEWTRWMIGEWEGAGESEAGAGLGVVRIEPALNGQFLFATGTARVTEMTPEQVQYLRDQMHASDEEIERFKSSPYTSLEIFTIDQQTGDVLAYMFDSLRCIATGRGRREGNKETIEWQYITGHKCTRITERLGDDRMAVIQRTTMPDGSILTEKGESIRRKPVPCRRTHGE